MDEEHQRFFMTEADMPLSWAQDAFRVIYNTYFQDEDYYLASNESVVDAALRPLIQTMELVGDDELEMSWAEMIEFQTGYPLKMPQAELLSFKIGRARRVGQGVFDDAVCHHHFGKTFNHSVTRNHLMQQGGVIVGIVGHWSRPLLDGGGVSVPSINSMSNRDDWYIKPIDDDDGNDRGDITASKDSINLFHGGEIYIPDTIDVTGAMTVSAGDVDPIPYITSGDTPDGDVAESSRSDATAEETHMHFYAEAWGGLSLLSGIDFT